MKFLLSTLLLCTVLSTIAQTKDTIFLQEVIVQKRQAKKDIVVKTSGNKVTWAGKTIRGMISKIDNLPEGQLKSIAFDFNSGMINLFKAGSGVEYREAKFKLLIYKANEDKSIGEPLSDQFIFFTIKANHRGAINLDLTPLNVDSAQTMYFGIELTDKQVGNDFVFSCYINPIAKTYLKFWGSESLVELPDKHQIKMSIKIAQ